MSVSTVELNKDDGLGFKWERKVVSSKVLFEIKQTSIKGTFYWDSHGKKIPWTYKDKKSFSRKCADVKVIEEQITINDGEYNFTQWDLYLNGVKYDLDISNYRINSSGNVTVKCEVGSG